MSHWYSWHTIPKQVGVKNALTKCFLPVIIGSCKVCHENVANWAKMEIPKIGKSCNILQAVNFLTSREEWAITLY